MAVTLQKAITLMLNQVIIAFIKINTMFYSKSQAIFAPVGSIDPNAALSAKEVDETAKMNSLTLNQALSQT